MSFKKNADDLTWPNIQVAGLQIFYENEVNKIAPQWVVVSLHKVALKIPKLNSFVPRGYIQNAFASLINWEDHHL
jgi:hypothetical protein